MKPWFKLRERLAALRDQRGLTLVELVSVSAILIIMAGVTFPVANTMVKRQKELELRRALQQAHCKRTQSGSSHGANTAPKGKVASICISQWGDLRDGQLQVWRPPRNSAQLAGSDGNQSGH